MDQDQPINPRQMEIEAYLAGGMSRGEAAAFEEQMRGDEALRREVTAWREALAAAQEWFEAEPPGVARADALPIPSLAPPVTSEHVIAIGERLRIGRRRASGARVRFWAMQALAAAAVFVIGFAIGHRAPAPAASSTTDRSVTLTGAGSQISAPPASVALPASTQSIPVQPVAEEPAQSPEPENFPPIETAREENGRVIIETTLRGSGARALWVVDGSFQVAGNFRKGNGQ